MVLLNVHGFSLGKRGVWKGKHFGTGLKVWIALVLARESELPDRHMCWLTQRYNNYMAAFTKICQDAYRATLLGRISADCTAFNSTFMSNEELLKRIRKAFTCSAIPSALEAFEEYLKNVQWLLHSRTNCIGNLHMRSKLWWCHIWAYGCVYTSLCVLPFVRQTRLGNHLRKIRNIWWI